MEKEGHWERQNVEKTTKEKQVGNPRGDLHDCIKVYMS